MQDGCAENAIRPFTVGRKNWLFCDTPKGADVSAIVYRVVETAKANGLEPYRYLKLLLTELPYLGKTPSQEDLMQFFPWSKTVPSRFMRKIVCRLRLSEVSRQ